MLLSLVESDVQAIYLDIKSKIQSAQEPVLSYYLSDVSRHQIAVTDYKMLLILW